MRPKAPARLPALAVILGCSGAFAQPQLFIHDPVPQAETLSGTFVIAVEDDFQSRTVRSIQYLIQAVPDMLQLVLADPGQVRSWRSGTSVRATGHRAGAQFLVDSIKIVAPGRPSGQAFVQRQVTSETGIPASGQRTVAVIPFTTQNQPTPVLDQPTGQAIMQQVHDYYEENSNGLLDMVSTVLPTLNLPITVECSDSDLETVWNEVQAVAPQSGINVADFDSVVMIGPGEGVCVGRGIAAVGGPPPEPALVRPTASPPSIWAPLISHELGHHLGLYLADAVDCGTTIIYDPRTDCTDLEFGDTADTMGLGEAYATPVGPHFNASFKKLLGWLEPQNVSTTGIYQVLPIETAEANSLAITPPGAGDTYYVEYRQPIGSDTFIPSPLSDVFKGVLVHYVTGSPSSFTSEIIDMHPAIRLNGGPYEFELLPGEGYVDYLNRFSLTTLSVSPQSAQVQVLFPVAGSPILAFLSPANGSTVTGVVSISIDALDLSGVSRVDLFLDGAMLASMTAVPYTYDWNTLTATPGQHQIRAVAYSTQGTSYGQQIAVTVPPQQIAGLLDGASFVQPSRQDRSSPSGSAAFPSPPRLPTRSLCQATLAAPL
jgi:hypothetical protein